MSATYPSLGVALRLARRELRGGLKGFRIFLACLALGVAAIASVQSVSSAILTGLRDDGQEILGGDISLRLLYEGPSEEQLAYLRRNSEQISHFTEMRTMARRLDGESSVLVEFKGVDAIYPLFGALELQQEQPFAGTLDKAAGNWGAVADVGVLDRLGLSVGDAIRIGDLEYQVRGLIKREPDRAGGGGNFGLGPRVMVSLDSLPETGLMQRGSLIYHQYRLKLPPGADLDRFQADLQQAFPTASWRIRDYRNAAPRVERMIERMTLFLTLVGLTALLVGGVGVSNAVKAYLDGKLSTIAMLKCVGAPNRTVFQTYMAQILALAAGGIAIGLVIGAVVPPTASWLLKDILPFRLPVALYPGALALAAIFGLLTTLAFAVWPLARVHEIPAGALFRDVIADRHGRPRIVYIVATAVSALLLAGLAIVTAEHTRFAVWFVIGAIATMAAFRFAAWAVMKGAALLRRPRHPGLRLAVSNLHRPGAPTPNVVLSLGLGLTVLVGIALIEGNMSRQVRDSIPEQAPAFFFVDIQSDQIDSFVETVHGVPGAGEIVRVPYLRGRIVAARGLTAEAALADPRHEWMIRGDRGLTYSATPPENAEIVAGEWWPDDYDGPPLISVHKDVTQAFGIDVGDTMTLNVLGRDITATVANVRDLEWRSMQINFAIMFSPNPLQNAPHTFIATLGADPNAELAIQREITRNYPNITTVRIKEALDKVNEIIGKIGAAVRSIAGVTVIAGTLVLAGAIAAGHRRRVYDSVVLKVLGATRRDVLRAFMLEYGLLGLVTALIAAVLGTITSWAVLTLVMNTDWVFIPSTVALVTVLCTAITLGLGFIGTWRALGQKAAPLLRND